MVRRLVEADFLARREEANAEDIRFWLRELRAPERLMAVAGSHLGACRSLLSTRALLAHALEGDARALSAALAEEEAFEREADRRYWEPLRKELDALRHSRTSP